MVANDVSPSTGTFGGEGNTVHLISPDGVEDWPPMSKRAVAERLVTRIAEELARTS
jgi:phosphopantothenoylcysteine decarboxylase/phosphopantothenate--cysteine ligase